MFSIDIDILINTKLTLEDYFLVTCIYFRDNESLNKYIFNFPNTITTNNIQKLIDLGYVINIGDISIFDNLYVTEKTKDIFNTTSNIDMFSELLSVYPKFTPDGRRLHGSLKVCKEKYLKKVKNDVSLHKIILKCVEYFISELTHSRNLNYCPLLLTYINQERWMDIIDDIRGGKTKLDFDYGTQDI